MCKAFECKLKGRLGREEGDLDEMRVLNRIVRVVPSGMLYEPDPRHVELLIKAMGLEKANSKATPGNNIPFGEIQSHPSDLVDVDELVSAVRLHKKVHCKVTFTDAEPEDIPMPSWYHMFPRSLFFSGPIGSEAHVYADPYM